MKLRYTLADMQRLARERGGRCLSKSFSTVHVRLKWICREGHRWTAPGSYITRGSWCKKCAIAAGAEKSRTHSIEEFRQIAAARGGECLSTEYTNTAIPLEWKCEKGHVWWAAPSDVIRRSSWCPKCAAVAVGKMRLKHTIEEMQQLAAEQGGACLSEVYVHNHFALQWRCGKGHEWSAEPDHIIGGGWCARCAWARLSEERRQYTLADMQQLAVANGGECLSTAFTSVRRALKWKCAVGHEWEVSPVSIMSGAWCSKCSFARYGETLLKYTLKDMQALAEERGGKLLSDTYRQVTDRLSWQCAKGHTWECAASTVLYGSWCRICARKGAGKRHRKYTLEDMQALAKKRGGKCLSLEFHNVVTNLRWECAQGHCWSATPTNIKRGTWCRKCSCAAAGEKRRKYTLADMQALAAEHGGECLSKTFTVITESLHWKCAKGHEFRTGAFNVQNGQWCRKCAAQRNRFTKRRRRFTKE